MGNEKSLTSNIAGGHPQTAHTVIRLDSNHYRAIAHHAERTYPEECCGLLFGWRMAKSEVIVTECWELQNAWTVDTAQEMADLHQEAFQVPATSRRRYWIDPHDLLDAQRYVRKYRERTANPVHQFDMIGIYHSHPDHPAMPSECDRACAWTEYSYIIVSVQQGRACDLLSWKLDDQHQFQPEALISTVSSSDIRRDSV